MLLQDEKLSQYTSWRVGGPAKILFKPNTLDDLQSFLSRHSVLEPMLWLGLGSNTLIRDKGFAGTVVVLQGGLTAIETPDIGLIRAEAGVACATLSRKTARMGLTGLEFMAGIPGTVGGALRMNAGCWGGETWRWVYAVETIDMGGNVKLRKPEEFDISYRSVQGLSEREWFVAGWFALQPGDKEQSLDLIRSFLAKRAQTQPTGEYNCGSVFRNPSGDHAARLIEHCGLKGFSIGDAVVSTKHANFITNRGNALASDIERLIEYVKNEVETKTGIVLTHEVHIVGEP